MYTKAQQRVVDYEERELSENLASFRFFKRYGVDDDNTRGYLAELSGRILAGSLRLIGYKSAADS